MTNIQKLIEFDKDCAQAIYQCPGQHYFDNEIDILKGDMSEHHIIQFWRNNNTLMNSGYHYYLSNHSKKIFRDIQQYMNDARLEITSRIFS